MIVFARLGVVVLSIATVAGCATAQARSTPDSPALVPPAPPGRLVIPSPLPAPIPVEVPPAPADPDPVDPPPDTPPNRTSRTTPPPTTPERQTSEPPVLRTAANVMELTRQTRQKLNTAQRDLAAVQRQELGADGQAHFDEVERLIRAANELLDLKNYTMARQLSDKAARLASELVKGGRPTGP